MNLIVKVEPGSAGLSYPSSVRQAKAAGQFWAFFFCIFNLLQFFSSDKLYLAKCPDLCKVFLLHHSFWRLKRFCRFLVLIVLRSRYYFYFVCSWCGKCLRTFARSVLFLAGLEWNPIIQPAFVDSDLILREEWGNLPTTLVSWIKIHNRYSANTLWEIKAHEIYCNIWI